MFLIQNLYSQFSQSSWKLHTHTTAEFRNRKSKSLKKKKKKLNLKKEETENHKLICNNRSNPNPNPRNRWNKSKSRVFILFLRILISRNLLIIKWVCRSENYKQDPPHKHAFGPSFRFQFQGMLRSINPSKQN